MPLEIAIPDAVGSGDAAHKIIPLFVTAGNRPTFDERSSWCVPSQELAATVQVFLQWRRLQVSRTLPQTATLVRETTAFQLKTTASRKEKLDAWRQGRHDDLVLAAAVEPWLGENAMRRTVVQAKLRIDAISTVNEGFDPSWLRNAVEEPLDEAGVHLEDERS